MSIKQGMTVMLKTGSPKMYVTMLIKNEHALCSWLENRKKRVSVFKIEDLKQVASNAGVIRIVNARNLRY